MSFSVKSSVAGIRLQTPMRNQTSSSQHQHQLQLQQPRPSHEDEGEPAVTDIYIHSLLIRRKLEFSCAFYFHLHVDSKNLVVNKEDM